MTREQALNIARICATADSGCPACVSSLFKKLNKLAPSVFTPELLFEADLAEYSNCDSTKGYQAFLDYVGFE
jgi:hypothetical protein